MSDPPPPASAPSAPPARSPGRRAFWRAPSFLVAAVAVAVGFVMWWRAPAPVPAPVPVPAGDSSASGLTRFAEGPSAPAPAPAPAAQPPLVGKDAPLPFRLGAGYVGGFLIGWAWRRSLRAALWVAGGAAALIATAKYLGIGGVEWSTIEAQVTEGLDWFERQAGVARKWLSGHLPAGIFSVLGFWRGARW